ncbi:hypothetical protein VPH35_116429 [Triticum aestivum]|uniref:COBRA-like protein 7 n=2 Tax=Triticinae TaxID=1648030 RepID=UPI00098B5003|nr:COBRA-like protein 7 [Triticum aestivum]XP_044419129.1 COBRA-like protein 7 [Triticum aestivum]XP_044419131.1 COBRA-like protein 7 [Triticum aestivum]
MLRGVVLAGRRALHPRRLQLASSKATSTTTPRSGSTPGYSLLLLLLLLLCCVQASAYDPLDPSGNITVSWDFLDIKDIYSVSVSLQNYQLYRHLEDPGWRLSWFWAGDEVILDAKGAEATEQGNCTRFVGAHSCKKRPVMMDLGPGTPYNLQVANCCRGGVLSSLVQNSKAATSTFMMTVGNFAPSSDVGPQMPFNFSIGVPGYTCSNATVVPPSRTQIDKQRHIQALSWAFPRKMYFDGGECAMPPPDDYPPLPSASCDQLLSAVLRSLLAGLVLLFLLF